jgi:two-component system alkaline phosphatase synthesis response regulator PhoP
MAEDHILVVDDEAHIRELLTFNLENEGFAVTAVADGHGCLRACEQQSFDLLILDIMMPGLDGLEVCRRVKSRPATAELPVIMLTAKGEEVDKIVGLELGADDYITKPFSVRELIARVKALLRRSGPRRNGEENPVIEIADLTIDGSTYEVTKSGKPLQLALKEFELLRLLAQNQGKVLTRDFLLNRIWGYDYFGETRTVDVHIRHLRRKLGQDVGQSYIETVRGVGYKFVCRDIDAS